MTEQPDNHNDGTMTYTCDACDHTKEESIPKLPDQFENVDTGITLDIPANSQAFLPMGTVIGVVEKPV
jgi:hypothetical protein